MLVRLETTVPVVVIVDTDEGIVTEVAVIDDQVADDWLGYYDDETEACLYSKTSHAIQARAIAIASDDQPWPSWSFGR
jgi:hypothetical protein